MQTSKLASGQLDSDDSCYSQGLSNFYCYVRFTLYSFLGTLLLSPHYEGFVVLEVSIPALILLNSSHALYSLFSHAYIS